MTTTLSPPEMTDPEPDPQLRPAATATAAPSVEPEPERPTLREQLTGRRVTQFVVLWAVVTIACIALVTYGLEPLFQQRTQAKLLDQYRTSISKAAAQKGTLAGVVVPTDAPEPGAPVGILEIGAVKVQQVVVEGATAQQTQAGPGHVPGTAGPGQPGNSVIVGRRATFGAPFGSLHQLEADDSIVVTTTQGQVLYKVSSVSKLSIVSPPGTGSTSGSTTTTVAQSGINAQASDAAQAAANAVPAEGVISVDELYGPTKDDRLTLVSSASAVPWNSSLATVVVAQLQGTPYAPTPQGGRMESQTGRTGEGGAWPALLLSLQFFALAAAAAVVLYRRGSPRVAYLLTMPPLVAFAVLAAESVSRLFPAWT